MLAKFTFVKNSGARARAAMQIAVARSKALAARGRSSAGLAYAKLSVRYAWTRYRTQRFWLRYRSPAVFIALAAAIAVSFLFVEPIQSVLAPYFVKDGARTAAFWASLSQIGSALFGVVAISFTIIVFAQQINVNRMPHGLFWRFSAGGRIMVSFAAVVFLAIALCAMSLIQDSAYVAHAMLAALWAIVLVCLLLIYAFRRSLMLINPIAQLKTLLMDASKELRQWSRRATRALPLLKVRSGASDHSEDNRLDVARAAYFKANPHWTESATRAVEYAIAFARRFAEQGDYRVSSNALDVIAEINRAYIDARGKTFLGSAPLLNVSETDGFINTSLEHLRQLVNLGISRKDERQLEQALQGTARLAHAYLGIEYALQSSSKFHAHLAARYLSDAVEAATKHRLVDVTMEGTRLLGQVALGILAKDGPDEITTLVDKIGLIGAVSVPSEQQRPATLTAMEQLSGITLATLLTKHGDIRGATRALRSSIAFVAKALLQVPDSPFSSVHSSNLAPYYSGTSTQTVLAKLHEWVNAVVAAPADNQDAQTMLRNIEEWAEDLYQSEKETLLLAIEKRSFLAFDVIHWIEHVSKLLLALTKAPACDEWIRDKLEDHAEWLISVISFIPDDAKSTAHIESQLTEILFGAASEAHDRGFARYSEIASALLLQWGFKAGRHRSGWGTLRTALFGVAALAVKVGDETLNTIRAKIAEYLSGPYPVEKAELARTAAELRKRAKALHRRGHWSSRIEHDIANVDPEKSRKVLVALADMLSPTAPESVEGSSSASAAR